VEKRRTESMNWVEQKNIRDGVEKNGVIGA
jgi:hypothetical protein